MRCLVAFAGLMTFHPTLSAGIVVDGVPVHGRVQAVSPADIHAAIASVRSENPSAKTWRIREIRVVDSANIYLVTTPVFHGSEARFEAKRIKGQWHYSTTYIGPP